MSNTWFRFKQFTIHQDRCAMKVTTDACLFGAWVASQIPHSSQPKTVLDIGTGTGLLSLMLAQAHPNLQIDAVEIDPEAAQQARENCANSPWGSRIRVIEGDIMALLPTLHKTYDIIITNPPFYENELVSENRKKNIAHHSNNLILNDLIEIIKNKISDTSAVFILFPAKREVAFINKLKESNLSNNQIVKIQQTPAHAAFRIFCRLGGKTQIKYEENIIITDYQGRYTAQFINLLQPYYLKL